MNTLLQDLLYGLRTLRKNPGFSCIAIGLLALGIGANTAIFSAVNSVLLRPLPYPNARQLVVLWETNSRLGVEREGPSGPNYLDWKQQSRSFDDMGLIENGTGVLTGKGEPEQFPGARVTPNFLELLGAKPYLGRTFTSADGSGEARNNVAVLTYNFWKRRFAGSPSVVGSAITVNHEPYTVIGVLGPDLWAPIRCDAFVPWPEGELRARRRDNRAFGVIARLKPGVTVTQATSELNGIAERIAKEHPNENGWGVTVVPFQDALVEYLRPALLMLLTAVGFVLLLTCANVANLLLARTSGRQREIAIRAAMGARRTRVFRQLLTESVLLSCAGGAVGLLLAVWGVDILSSALPQTIPLPNAATEVIVPPIRIDAGVLMFTAFISILGAVIFGIIPALQASRIDLNQTLKESGRSSSPGLRQGRTRQMLVIAETALAFMLLMGAGLMLKSFHNLQQVNVGIRPEHVLTFHLRLPTDTMYKTAAQQREFYDRVLARVQAVPGVRTAGITDVLPLSQEASRTSFTIQGRAEKPEEEPMADFRRASPRFFETMGIPLLKGRVFSDSDRRDTRQVAIVDESFAHRYFANADPIGQRLHLLGRDFEIVGMIGPVRHYGLDKPARPVIYVPYPQVPCERMVIAVRSPAAAAGLTNAIKRAVWDVDVDQPVFLVRTMDEYIAIADSAPKIALLLLAIFAGTALLLAAFGIYGVVAYTVSQRTHEFGVRIALGARPADVRNTVVREGAVLALIGLAAGIAGSLLLAPALRSFLYGVSAIDPIVLLSAAAALLLVALAANYLPAMRTTRIDPVTALRYE